MGKKRRKKINQIEKRENTESRGDGQAVVFLYNTEGMFAEFQQTSDKSNLWPQENKTDTIFD